MFEAFRVESSTPVMYRLRRKIDGEYVLEGAYSWNEGDMNGMEWREIPTEKESKSR